MSAGLVAQSAAVNRFPGEAGSINTHKICCESSLLRPMHVTEIILSTGESPTGVTPAGQEGQRSGWTHQASGEIRLAGS